MTGRFWLCGVEVAPLSSFLLQGYTNGVPAQTSAIQRMKGRAGVLFVHLDKPEAGTPPGHDIRREADSPYNSKL